MSRLEAQWTTVFFLDGRLDLDQIPQPYMVWKQGNSLAMVKIELRVNRDETAAQAVNSLWKYYQESWQFSEFGKAEALRALWATGATT